MYSADDDRGKKRKKTTQPRLMKADWFGYVLRDLFTIAKATSFVFACMRKQITCLSSARTEPSQEDLAKHEIFVDQRSSTLLPKCQVDIVTANDHAKSAIIAHMRTVLTLSLGQGESSAPLLSFGAEFHAVIIVSADFGFP